MRVDLNLAALLAYGVLLGVLSWKVAAPFWAYLILGGLIATLAFPVHEKLRAWTDRARLSAALTVSLALLLVIIPVSLLGWKIIQDIRTFVADLTVESVTGTVQDILLWSSQTLGYPREVEADAGRQLLADQVPVVRQMVGDWALHALRSSGEFVIGIMLTVIVAYYGLVHGQRFLARFKDASPMDDELEAYFFEQTKFTINGVIWGQIITALLQGALGWLAFVIVGIPNALFWGFVMAILSFLPLVGAFLVWVPAAIYLFAGDQTVFAIGLLVWGIIVVSVSDDLVRPMIIGKSAALHPVLAFVGVLGGLVAFGIMGFVLGPLILSLFAVVFNILADSEWNLEDWEPPSEDEPPPEAEADEPGEPAATAG